MTDVYMREAEYGSWRVYKRGFFSDSALGTYDFQGALARLKELGAYYRPSRATIYDKNWRVKSAWGYEKHGPIFK